MGPSHLLKAVETQSNGCSEVRSFLLCVKLIPVQHKDLDPSLSSWCPLSSSFLPSFSLASDGNIIVLLHRAVSMEMQNRNLSFSLAICSLYNFRQISTSWGPCLCICEIGVYSVGWRRRISFINRGNGFEYWFLSLRRQKTRGEHSF